MTKTPYLFKLVGGQAYLIKRRERYLEWNEGRGAGGDGNACDGLDNFQPNKLSEKSQLIK